MPRFRSHRRYRSVAPTVWVDPTDGIGEVGVQDRRIQEVRRTLALRHKGCLRKARKARTFALGSRLTMAGGYEASARLACFDNLTSVMWASWLSVRR